MAGLAALQYAPASFDVRVGKLMGRQVASGGLLRAWVAHGGADPVTGWVDDRAHGAAFAAHVAELGGAAPVALAGVDDFTPLAAAGALFLADPGLERYAWQRRWFDQDRWSLIGITHTLSSHAAMERIAALVTAPVQRWDALICTSRAVKAMVEELLGAEADYLIARIGATRCTAVELPVIPLGVDCAAFAARPGDRERWRARLGLGAADVAILQVGRLSLHAKAHVLPLYLALAEAAARTGLRPRLVLAGQFPNPGQAAIYRDIAAGLADRVATSFVDGARADVASLWPAGDVFALLSDNIQESFGLAPVEAMAAGLPVVASDWDGLRDTIEEGVTGFRVETLMPPPGAGRLIARRYDLGQDDYDRHVGAVSQQTAVDIAAAADRFARLMTDATLRRTMGEAGRVRARRLFDWPVVIGQYRALLERMAALRREGSGMRAPQVAGAPVRPGRPDPFRAFAGHASGPLTGAMRLERVAAGGTVAALAGGPAMTMVAPQSLPSLVALEAMLARIGDGPVTIAGLLDAFPDRDRPRMLGGIAWMMKFGLVRRVA